MAVASSEKHHRLGNSISPEVKFIKYKHDGIGHVLGEFGGCGMADIPEFSADIALQQNQFGLIPLYAYGCERNSMRRRCENFLSVAW
jgi:Ribonuclease T2 family